MKCKVISRDVRAHPSTVIFEWKSEIMLHAVNSSNELQATVFNVLYVYNKTLKVSIMYLKYMFVSVHMCNILTQHNFVIPELYKIALNVIY